MDITNFLKDLYRRGRNSRERVMNSLFGNTEYKKFVIISDARTGSTLLQVLLDKHSEIIAGGEIFKQLGNRSCKEIWNNFFQKRPGKIKWVGFKLFYDHPWQSEDREVWDFIKEDKSIVIIHLIRKNILRSYISKQIGLKTKLWTENTNRPHSLTTQEKTVEIDPKSCLSNLNEIYKMQKDTDRMFKDHNMISVTYEELSRDKNEVMRRVFSELKVGNQEILTAMKKQNPENLEDLVINYEELKNQLINTKWNFCLDENSPLKTL